MPSELNVNKISPASGTEVSLGDSGDTITITSGVTLAGDGSNLTALNATQLTTGTIPIARIADDAITNAKMADDAIGVAQLSATGTASNSVFLRGDNAWAAAGGGKVLQVIQNHDTTTRSQSLTANTRANISGLNATITPSATTSKILVSVRWNGEGSTTLYVHDSLFGVKRDTTDVGLPATSGSRRAGITIGPTNYHSPEAGSTPEYVFYEYLDSPGVDVATTYHGTVIPSGDMTLYTNRTVADSDYDYVERMTSTITLWEIGA